MRARFVTLIGLFAVTGCVMQYKYKYVPISTSDLETRYSNMARGIANQIENPRVIPENAHISREPAIYLPPETLCRDDGTHVKIYGPRIVGDQLCGSGRYVHSASDFDLDKAVTTTCLPLSSLTHFTTVYEGSTFGIYPMTYEKLRCPQ